MMLIDELIFDKQIEMCVKMIVAVGHMVRPAEEIRARGWAARLFGQQHHAQAALRRRYQRDRATALHHREDGRGDGER